MIQYHAKQLLSAITIILTLISIPYAISSIHAQSSSGNDFVAVTEDNIKNNPTLAKILENIEKSRQDFAEIQQKTDQEKFIDEQRTVSKQILEQKLEQMFEDNKDFTSLAAFNNFLKTVSDDNTKDIFKGLFDYKQNKIDSAKSVMGDILRNGGSLQDARNAYHDALQIPRSDMIRLVNNLNIEAGFSNPTIQDHFDDDGKLPRYEDEQESVVSFVDLTTSAQNINSSSVKTSDDTSTETSDDTSTETSDDTSTETSDDTSTETSDDTSTETSDADLIQKLLDEIRFLKNKIATLEKNQNIDLQQVVFQQQNVGSLYFADFVSEYTQGLGHHKGKIKDVKTIPVNALNEPDSYKDINNSLALGRQGQVTLGFSESITDKLIVYETSAENNIRELATVEVSVNGKDWTVLTQTQHQSDDSYVDQYIYDLSEIGCISHVRITDNAPSAWGDGFDVDALGATKLCNNST